MKTGQWLVIAALACGLVAVGNAGTDTTQVPKPAPSQTSSPGQKNAQGVQPMSPSPEGQAVPIVSHAPDRGVPKPHQGNGPNTATPDKQQLPSNEAANADLRSHSNSGEQPNSGSGPQNVENTNGAESDGTNGFAANPPNPQTEIAPASGEMKSPGEQDDRWTRIQAISLVLNAIAFIVLVVAVVAAWLDRGYVSHKIRNYADELAQIVAGADAGKQGAAHMTAIVSALTSVDESVKRLNARLDNEGVPGSNAAAPVSRGGGHIRADGSRTAMAENTTLLARSSAAEVFNQHHGSPRFYDELAKLFSGIAPVSCLNLDDRQRSGAVLRFQEMHRGNYIVVVDGTTLWLLPRSETDLRSTSTLDGIFQRQSVGLASPILAQAAMLRSAGPGQYELVKPGLIHV